MSDIENSQQLSPGGEEPCPGPRHSSESLLKVDGREAAGRYFRNLRGRNWSRGVGAPGQGECGVGGSNRVWETLQVGLLSTCYIIYLTNGSHATGLGEI